MKVLVACERSGKVRDAFTKLGHDATSCDMRPSKTPGKHYQGDIRDILDKKWDLMVAHPPCTYLTVTGNKWFLPKFNPNYKQRLKDREEAVEFFMELANADIPMIAIENPIGIMSTRWRKPDQIIQPYEFGHKEAKKTGLWLKGLPKLKGTELVEPEYITFPSGKRMAKWYADAYRLPPEEREMLRSETFEGISNAMAEQWGSDKNKRIYAIPMLLKAEYKSHPKKVSKKDTKLSLVKKQ